MIQRICFAEDRCYGKEQNPVRYITDGAEQGHGTTWKLSFPEDQRFVQIDSIDRQGNVALTEFVPVSTLISITIKRQVEDGPETKKSKK